jgi:hypothetical protein
MGKQRRTKAFIAKCDIPRVDWGRINGRLVALDYSTPAHDTTEENRRPLSSIVAARMHPNIGRDHLLFRQPDHVNRRTVTRRPA